MKNEEAHLPSTKTAPAGSDLDSLLAIMARLRGPGGCPWDREQNEQTLKKYLLEESFETLEAIETGGPGELREELGDLLLQIIFLCRIAEEKGQFNFADVARGLASKLIRRHPHVFPPPGGEQAEALSPGDVVKIWGKVKEKEGKYARRDSLLDGIPLALPALERALRISKRVARVGFDWPDLKSVWEKVKEEMAEVENAHGEEDRPEAVEEELGDLLFALVNWGRFQGISAEETLRRANRRFSQRFYQIELSLRQRGRTPEQSTLEEMEELWNEAKKKEK